MTTRRQLLVGSAAASGIATVAMAAPAPEPDAELLALGKELDAAYAIEKAAWAQLQTGDDDDSPRYTLANDLNDETNDIVGEIELTSATTLAGVLVKMRAIDWCRNGDPLTVAELTDSDSPATDVRLLAGVVRDLVAMGA